jgi:hypothetical protein
VETLFARFHCAAASSGSFSSHATSDGSRNQHSHSGTTSRFPAEIPLYPECSVNPGWYTNRFDVAQKNVRRARKPQIQLILGKSFYATKFARVRLEMKCS